MLKLIVLLTTILIILVLNISSVCAGTLDNRYLSAFGEHADGVILKTNAFTLIEDEDAHRCLTPLKHDLRRDFDQLEPSTQKVLAKYIVAPVLANEVTFISSNGNFLIHYATTGPDALFTSSEYALATWLQSIGDTFEDVLSAYLKRGYRKAPTNTGSPYYDIFLRDFASQSVYGVTTSLNNTKNSGFNYAYSSYIEIDKSFTNSIYTKNGKYTPLQSVQITAAHEYFHAIQYGYNLFFDTWYAEAASTWYEDELYDSINQLYSYIPAWFNNSALSLDQAVTSNAVNIGAGYGRWIFNRYLAEQHSIDTVRLFWETLAGIMPISNQDIPMSPVLNTVLSASYGSTLSDDFLGFAKNIYKKSWSSHTNDLSIIPNYSAVAKYSNYPVSPQSYPVPQIQLPHYSFVYYRFAPTQGEPADLEISVNSDSGIRSAVFSKLNGIISETMLISGTSYIVKNFSSYNTISDEVVLLIANTTDLDNQVATFNAKANIISTQQGIQGDVNSDGIVDIFDALLTLQYSLNLIPHTAANNILFISADVSPLDVNGKPEGDGIIDVFDALLILQRSVNLLRW